MKIIIDTDLIKRYVEDNHVAQVIYDDGNNLSDLSNLIIEGETIWYPCYKGHTAVVDEAVAPTCTEPGLTEGSHCAICGEVLVAQEEVPATGHSWGDTIYTWAADYSVCIAKRVCTNDAAHTETLQGVVGSSITTAPTCTTDGVKTYTAIFTDTEPSDWALENQTTTESIPSVGHSWNDPTYDWSDDLTTCVATRTCKNDSSHTETAITNAITNAVTTEPTCTGTGVTTYTATFSESWAGIRTTTSMIPPNGHTYEMVRIPPTCTEDGCTTHTCEVCGDSYDVTEDALGHNYGEWTITLEPACTTTGIKRRNCLRPMCDHYETEDIPALGHTSVQTPRVNATCTEPGLTEGSHCNVCGEVIVAQEEVPALGHILTEWIVDEEPTVNSTGSRHKDCLRPMCDYSEIEVIPKLDPLTYELSYNGEYYYVKATNTDIRSNTDTDGLIIIPSEYNGLPVTRIAGGAFEECGQIKQVVIPDSITHIEAWAFDSASNLTTVTIPNSVIEIRTSAFGSCTSMETVYFDPGSQLTSIGYSAFADCSSLTSIEIPNSVTSIGEKAFMACYALKQVTIPASVTSIGDSAFSGCSSLTSIEIPNSVTSIGDSAFSGCSSLTSIEIPNSVTSIGDSAFSGCSSLTSIEIPNSVTSIGEKAFMACYALKQVTIPASVTHIGAQAFTSIRLLEAEITLLNKDCWKTTGTRLDGTLEDVYIDVDTHTSRELAVLLTQTYSYYEWNAEEHAYGEWYIINAPTCAKTGTKRRDCANCGHYETEIIPIREGHSYKSIVTLPTCTEQGYTTHVCTDCGDSYQDTYVPATGHSYTSVVKAPTCTARGYTEHTCKICGHSYRDNYIDALGHTEVIDPAVAATCTTAGKTEGKHCSTCNEVLVAQTTIQALGHLYSKSIVAPTCTEQGYDLYTCSRCDHTYKDNYTNATGHTEVIDEAVEPTCTTTGLTEGKHCSVCNEVLVEQQVVTGGHVWGIWNIVKTPTCTTAGRQTRNCTICGTPEVNIIPATGVHTEVAYPDVAPTTTTVGYTGGSYCSVCGTVLEARTPILKTPVITDAVATEQGGVVDVWVQNNNSVPVDCCVLVIDDDETEVGDDIFYINANGSGHASIAYSDSAAKPLVVHMYFESADSPDYAHNRAYKVSAEVS